MKLAQQLRAGIRGRLLKMGIDVRKVTSLKESRAARARDEEIRKWRFIKRYQPATILDIGANEGQFAALARHHLPDARIICFEPLHDCCEHLRTSQQRLAPLDIIHTALGAETSTLNMNRNASSPSSSLLEMKELHYRELPHTREVSIETVQLQRLDDLQPNLQLATPYFIKIDVQGYTMPVLQGGQNTVKQAAALVAEISTEPLYDGEATFRQIFEMMSDLNFVFRGTVDQWLRKSDGAVLQMDCLFESLDYVPKATPQAT